ncbi:MAG: MarR family transcriptional regulator [Planctomycetota bacterium]|nr:MAG: MarR family transcriptional regulator [Planctomycetota bacterium]
MHVYPRFAMSPLPSQRVAHDLAARLRDAYWAMHRLADSHLERHDITADQFVLLAALADEDGLAQPELCRRTSSNPSAMPALLGRLETRGFIVREQYAADHRARCVKLTPHGRHAFAELWAYSEPFRALLVADFTPREAETLAALLARVPEAMRRAAAVID